MKKRIATLLSASMILSSLVMPVTTLSVFADDFADDTVMAEEITDDEFIEEDDFADEFEIETEAFEEETETTNEKESDEELEEETEINEKYEASGSFDGFTWSLSNGTLTINGKGEMWLPAEYEINGYTYKFYGEDKRAPWYDYRSGITKVIMDKNITSIDYNAFRETNITEITIPENVEIIWNNAFQDCHQLKKVTMSNKLEAIEDNVFRGTAIESITIPTSVDSIGSGAFAESNLRSITIPDNVSMLGNGTFYGCSFLESVKLSNKIRILYLSTFKNCINLTDVTLPNGLQEIMAENFDGCIALRSITLPETVLRIDEGTFRNCFNLQQINLTKNMFHIDKYVFENCYSLRSLTLPFGLIEEDGYTYKEGIARIYDYAFVGCKNLTLTIECPYIDIYDNAFAYAEGEIGFIPGLRIISPKNSTADLYAESYGINHSYLPTKEEKIEAFVSRMYSSCLGRRPDANGLAYWMDLLVSGKESGASAAYGFIFSNESKAKNLCNSCFIEQLYSCFMGRRADSTGKTYWLNMINSGKTRAQVFEGFVNSIEFKKICTDYGITLDNGVRKGTPGFLEGDCKNCGAQNKTVLQFIERMYTTCLGRGSDKGGRQYWLDQLKKGKTGLDLALGFLTSDEIKRKNLSDSAFIDTCYKAFFGRNADKGGKDYWLDQIKKGKTREDLIKGFAASNEFQALCREYGIPAK